MMDVKKSRPSRPSPAEAAAVLPMPADISSKPTTSGRFLAAGITTGSCRTISRIRPERGTIRGLHFQLPPAAQAKLVRVVQGSVYDVAVDLRAGSPTYGRWEGATLTAEDGEQLFVPHGFAHGFCTLEPDTVVAYKVDEFYAPASDSGLIWNDPTLAIDWPVRRDEAVLSDKDLRLGRFADFGHRSGTKVDVKAHSGHRRRRLHRLGGGAPHHPRDAASGAGGRQAHLCGQSGFARAGVERSALRLRARAISPTRRRCASCSRAFSPTP